ncbi:MAG: cyclodeaminase/cyclohydrolase family protein, partial [Gammaproteobacteria bacterium]|nr:cyclodeaminase/cyclohydrolase family protein [Gammaproteobacteria bacterium]
TPGGGAVAAVVAAEACSLVAMVANFSKGDVAKDIAGRAHASIANLLELGDQDALAFETVMKAFKGEGDISNACLQAADIPAQVIGICLTHIEDLEHLSAQGNPNLITDTAIASLLFDSALKSSELNILINMKSFDTIPADLKSAINNVPGATSRLQFIASTIRTGLS